MAHSKNHTLTCPRCDSTDNVYCNGGKVKILDSMISVEYIFSCRVCGLIKTRTMFSEYQKGIKIHGLRCPFCGSGRKRHSFFTKLKEVGIV